MVRIIIMIVITGASLTTLAQGDLQQQLDEINRSIDQAVVQKDIPKLQQLYADDFVFTHGTGVIDSKESWIDNIRKSTDKFVSRTHDSTRVELHSDVAILTGRLMVTKE